jgi:hypothetical protein
VVAVAALAVLVGLALAAAALVARVLGLIVGLNAASLLPRPVTPTS